MGSRTLNPIKLPLSASACLLRRHSSPGHETLVWHVMSQRRDPGFPDSRKPGRVCPGAVSREDT